MSDPQQTPQQQAQSQTQTKQDKEDQQQAELDAQNQIQEKINQVKESIVSQLDKLGGELFAHLKSTGQVKPKQTAAKSN